MLYNFSVRDFSEPFSCQLANGPSPSIFLHRECTASLIMYTIIEGYTKINHVLICKKVLLMVGWACS